MIILNYIKNIFVFIDIYIISIFLFKYEENLNNKILSFINIYRERFKK